MTSQENAIVVCASGNWLPYAATTLWSCVDKGGQGSSALYLVTYETSSQQTATAKAFFERRKIAVTIINADLSAELKRVQTGRFSTATMLRLTLDQLVPANHKRLLYLDSDTLVMRDLDPLFTMDMKGKSIAASEDYISLTGLMSTLVDYPRKIGMARHDRYFNAGVILFDWPKTIREGRLSRCIQRLIAAAASGKPLRFHDQDALNLEFERDWIECGAIYNFMAFKSELCNDHPVIRHFNSRNKPWGGVWIPQIGYFKKNYLEALSGTSYEQAVSKKFRTASIAEIFEYLNRKFIIWSGLRRLENSF